MAEHGLPFVPLWARGQPGFKADPNRLGGWSWRYLDFNGFVLEECQIRFDTEQTALASAGKYWIVNRTRLEQLALKSQQLQAKRKTAPEI